MCAFPQDSSAAELDFKGNMESLSASDSQALDQYESLREKERKSTAELEAARKAAIDKLKSSNQPR